MIVYHWDEVGIEITEIKVPRRWRNRRLSVISQISKWHDNKVQCLGFAKKYRKIGPLQIIDGLFGQDKEYHMYFCPRNPGVAKFYALMELSERFPK